MHSKNQPELSKYYIRMNSKQLVKQWFAKWTDGDFLNLPISENFKHTSPFGTITGKQTYLDLVKKNMDKFLGYTFTIHDGIYENQRACVRYTARQGEDFSLDVSEWYYFSENLLEEIVAYYHIGEVQEERRLARSK